MKLSVYGPDSSTFPLVLVPECMMPSIQMGHNFGKLYLRGAVELEEATLRAVSNPEVFDAATEGLEFAVTSQAQAHRILSALT